ncbi:hypothetical protein [Streptomyces sp. NPDC005336]|uniref:hypothetical protein n=1 Tax=Streptomyces sp. NPDC005336 TaxID=3157035 RepID=UPI0033A9E315
MLWWLSSAEGRLHTGRGFWLVVMLLATLPISYLGEFGPGSVMAFPFGTLLEMALALGVYYWAVASGFATEELEQAVAVEIRRAEAEKPAAAEVVGS